MPLGARDILMVIRARDLASRDLRQIGTNMALIGDKGTLTANKLYGISSALTAVGIGFAAAGGAGVYWLEQSTDAAIKYNQEAAKTLTQVDQIGVSLETIKDIGRDVAREIPAPFEEMQTSLYDIFSSMDVTISGSRLLLREFSRAAVAGQVDLQDASRATIGILNAYGLEAKDVTRINDVMFQLVRKGVGTYGEFAEKIGMSVPAAVRAGQSIETLSGMLAFLTRNGLNVASATASAGRALENLANPKVVERLEDMGVKVRDAQGEFRPMIDIVGQLTEKLGKLTKPEQAAALQELLKGTGNNIQARRFWSLAIQNFDELQQRVGEMSQSAGALDNAYKIMFEQPQSQIQLLKNNYAVLRTEVGDKLLPVKMKLAEIALALLDRWNGLSEGTQDLIIKIVAITSAFLLVSGIVLTVVGAIGMLIATLMMLGLTFGGALLVIGGFMAALIAIPVIIFLIVKHFDTLKEVAGKVWDFIKDKASAAWQMLQDFWDWLSDVGVSVWQAIAAAAGEAWGALLNAWEDVVGAFKKGYQWLNKNFGEGFRKIIGTIVKEGGALLTELGETFGTVFGGAKMVVDLFLIGFKTGWEILRSYVVNVLMPVFMFFASYFKMAFDIIMEVVRFALTFVKAYIETVVGGIIIFWESFGGIIMSVVRIAWNWVTTYISAAIKIISNVVQLFLNIFQGDWGEAWKNVKNILSAAWTLIKNAIKTGIDLILVMIRDLPGAILRFLGNLGSLLWQKGRDVMNGMFRGMINIADTIWDWVRNLPNRVGGLFRGAGRWLWDAGKAIIQGLWDGMKSIWEGAKDWLGGLPGAIVDLKGPPAKDAVLLINNGMLIMQGLQKGLMKGWSDVEKTLQRMTNEVSGNVTVNTQGISPSTGGTGGNGFRPGDDQPPPPTAGMVVQGDLVVREEAVTDDLDWWARSRLQGV